MIGILKASAAALPGCHSYVIAKDAADANIVWVTELWDSHEPRRLGVPSCRTGGSTEGEFEKVAVTEPVWEVRWS
jgi:hypothetical protein